MIPYGRQSIDEADVAAVCEALRDAMLTQGPKVAQFESELARVVGARYAVAFNSGTAALHGAYFAAGIGPGRGVLTSPITFAATANAALYLGGTVRFSDVDPNTAMLDLSQVDAAADDSVHVVTPVHFGGQVVDMEALAGIAGEHGWTVIEDAAHALGARYRDHEGREHVVGACAHSAMCCFSFHPVKHITTGEGGAVTTNDESLFRRLRLFRTHGITRERDELETDDGPWYYEQQELGFNYRITDFQCALGLSQLKKLTKFVGRRREIAARYDTELAEVPFVRPLAVPPWSCGSYHLYVVRVPAAQRRATFESLRDAGIGVNVHYVPVYRHPYYRANGFAGFSLAGADQYYAEAITIPLHHGMSDEDVAQVVDAVSSRRLVAAK